MGAAKSVYDLAWGMDEGQSTKGVQVSWMLYFYSI